jgi:hypothetical protein
MTMQNQEQVRDDVDGPDEFNQELLAAINEHRATAMARTAYVVPLAELWSDFDYGDEMCVVVPLPGVASGDVSYEGEHLYAEVCELPDGTSLHCLMCAAGRVALSGWAVHVARAERTGRLNILWMFDDNDLLREYRFGSDLAEDMWVASRIEDSHSTPKPDGVNESRVDGEPKVIGIYEHIVVQVEETT